MWSLGCILYELITFEPAFNARSLPELYRIIRVAKFNKRKISNYSYLNLINLMLSVDQNLRPNIEYILNNIPNLNNEKDNKQLDKTCNKILPALIIPKNKYQWDDILPKPAYSPLIKLKKNISEPVLNDIKAENNNLTKFDAPIFRSKSVIENNKEYYQNKNKLDPINKLKEESNNEIKPINRNYVAKYNYYKRNEYNYPKYNNRYNYPSSNNRYNYPSSNNVMYNRVDNNNLPKIINHADKYLEKENEKKNLYGKNKMSYGKNYISPYNQFLIKKDINLMKLRYNKNNYVSEYKDKYKNYN